MQQEEHYLMTYECIGAIGTSLELGTMIDNFLDVFSKKTGVLASAYWEYNDTTESYQMCSFYGTKTFEKLFVMPQETLCNGAIVPIPQSTTILLHVKLNHDWLVFLAQNNEADIQKIKTIIDSFKLKLENAIRACKNFLELKTINETLEKRIYEEVAKNREKDKHILQQSRLAQMGEMISMIAHQWRQPLCSISTVSASLKLKITLNRFNLDSPDGRDEQKQFLNDSMNKIEGYVQFLTHTIDDFRNFFKPNKHKVSTTSLFLVNRTLDIIGKALEINDISLSVENKASKEFFTYSNEVTQVILNILKNAEDVIKERAIEDGHIKIVISESDDTQFIAISDNAGGIRDDVLPYIFEPYYSTKSEKNGTGLGLYMSKMIIEDHCGGQITAQNDALGARFMIKLKEI